MPEDAWLTAALGYYTRLEFFPDPPSREGLAAALPRPGDRWRSRDVDLLELDTSRTLFLDFESPGLGGHGMYWHELPRLARITRGVFAAWDIEERALDDERGGRVALSFRTGATRHAFEVGGGNFDWIDPQLLWIVDDFLKVSPYRLHAFGETVSPGQECMLVVVNEEERAAIERDRGVELVPLPPEPSPPWLWAPPSG